MAIQKLEIPLPNGRKISINIDVGRETVSVSGARFVGNVGIALEKASPSIFIRPAA